MQVVLWAIVAFTLISGIYRLVHVPTQDCGLKANHPTTIYSQKKLDKSGRLHGVTKILMSDDDNARRLKEPP